MGPKNRTLCEKVFGMDRTNPSTSIIREHTQDGMPFCECGISYALCRGRD